MSPALPEYPLFLALGDAFVEAWQGVPFQWDGRDRRGVDCWGLAVKFFAAVHAQHLPDWRRGDHGRAWISRTIAGQAQSHWRPLAEPENGALVLVEGARGTAHHFGIYWRGNILHAAEGRGVILERLAEFAQAHPAYQFGAYVP